MHIFTSPVCDTILNCFFLINLILQLSSVGVMQKPLKFVLTFFYLYKNEHFFTASDMLALCLFFLAKKHMVNFSYICKEFFFRVLFMHSERAALTNLNWRLGTAGVTVGSTVASHSNNIKQNVQITRPHILKYSSLCCP